MLRTVSAFVLFCWPAATASAHFVFVVPAKDKATVTIVFSDDLSPDEAVSIDKIAGLKLTSRAAGGKETALECQKGEHCLTAKLGANEPVLVHGSIVYGLTSRTGVAPTLLIYHPKVILGQADGKEATVGEMALLEVVPVRADGKLKFQLLARGKPVAEAEGSIVLPDGKNDKLKTDKNGFTAAFEESGRYGVWLRHVETKAGEHDGKKYEEVRHYATLVVDHSAPKAAAPPLPEAVSSFGATVSDGYV